MNLVENALSQGDFRSYLQQVLVGRCRNNPNYSLRAFARSLGIGPAALSDMLNGKRSITALSIERIGAALELSAADIRRFQKRAPSSKPKLANEQNAKFKALTADIFALTSDWYYSAILELMKVEGFQPSPVWIASALGLTKTEVNVAIERLVRVGLIEVAADGSWKDLSEGFSTTLEPGLTSLAAKTLQRQILKQAADALFEVPLEERDQSAMTMAIDPADLPEARRRIKEFRRELCLYLERDNSPKEVYQLSISLFPNTRLGAKSRSGENK